MSKFISLTRGKQAIVDDEDFEKVNQYKWYAHFDGNNWYAVREILLTRLPSRRKRTRVIMHRYVLGLPTMPDGLMVDHANGNGLDNRKSNLRLVTNGQNMFNRRMNRNSTAPYKGISWYRRSNKWQAQISVNHKKMCLGYFDNPEDAAHAYDKAARQYFGEYAHLNFKD